MTDGPRDRHGLSRRRFLASAALAVGAAGALGGCQEPADRTFTADHVILPDGARSDLGLVERTSTTREMRETTSVEGTETIVAIENAITAYGRAEREPSLLGRFADEAGPTPTPTDTDSPTEGEANAAVDGASNAVEAASLPDRHGPMRAGVVVPGSHGPRTSNGDLEAYIGGPDGAGADVAPEDVSFVVPESARADAEEIASEDVLTLVAPDGVPDDATFDQPGGPGSMHVVSAAEFFPNPAWNPADGGENGPTAGGSSWLSRWFAGRGATAYDGLEDPSVLVVTGEGGPEATFGVSAEEMPGERVEAGDDLQPYNPFLVAAPGDVAVGGQSPFTAEAAFDAGRPWPDGGRTFGLATLATPGAEVDGEQLNDLLDAGVEEFLHGEQGRRLVGDALPFSPGVPDYDLQRVDVPEDVEMYPAGTNVGGLIPDETRMELYGGAFDGDIQPWYIGVHAVRATREEGTVFAVGTHVRPIGSTAGSDDRPVIGGDEESPALWPKGYIAEHGEMAAVSVGRLERES